jgi:hypothetical protein
MKNIIIGIFITLAIAIIFKIIFYFIIVLIDKIILKYFTKPNYIFIVKNILNNLSNNKQFISDVSKMIDSDNGIDYDTSSNIISMCIVQNFIQSEMNSSDIKLDKEEIEERLKLIFLKYWGHNFKNELH